jgi:hypothetical protein
MTLRINIKIQFIEYHYKEGMLDYANLDIRISHLVKELHCNIDLLLLGIAVVRV